MNYIDHGEYNGIKWRIKKSNWNHTIYIAYLFITNADPFILRECQLYISIDNNSSYYIVCPENKEDFDHVKENMFTMIDKLTSFTYRLDGEKYQEIEKEFKRMLQNNP